MRWLLLLDVRALQDNLSSFAMKADERKRTLASDEFEQNNSNHKILADKTAIWHGDDREVTNLLRT